MAVDSVRRERLAQQPAVRRSALAASDLVPITTVALGLSLAVAPAVGTLPVAAVSVLWFMAVAVQLSWTVRRLPGLATSQWILVAATVLAVVRLCSSGLTQVIGDRPTLFWNLDWRYAATQAQGITRFGSLDDSLDYAGQPVQYHVGPAWMAGSLDRVLGVPANAVLLVGVPLASTVVIVLCSVRLLRLMGVGSSVAALAAALPLSMPSNPYLLLRQSYGSFRGQAPLWDVLTNAEHWWFSQELMLNSMTGLAVGLSACCLLVGRTDTLRVVVGAAGIGSLLATKPQYAVGLLAVLTWGLLRAWWPSPSKRARILWATCTFGATAALSLALNPSAIGFVGVNLSVEPAILADVLKSYSLLVGALMVGAVLLAHDRRQGNLHTPISGYALGAFIGAVALFIVFETTTFLVSPEAVRQANQIGLAYTTSSQDSNLAQALRPAVELVALLAVALLIGHAHSRPRLAKALVAASLVLVGFTVPLTVRPLLAPSGPGAYETAEEPALARLMSSTDVDQGRWLSNDLADPAENYARPLRATNLTSFSTAQFYLSNAAYMGWTNPDVVQRVTNLQRFFLTAWSPWHAEFLAENNIRHIIIRDRCPTAWPGDDAGTVVGVDGSWTLVDVDTQRPTTESKTADTQSTLPLAPDPKYGLSACLDGRGPKP